MTEGLEVRTLPAFTRRDVQLLLIVSVTFSFAGGILQELHRAAGPSAIPIIAAQVASNLAVSFITVLVALVACGLRQRLSGIENDGSWVRQAWMSAGTVPMVSALLGGMAGGLLSGLLTRGRVDVILIVTSGAWMLMANVLVRVVGNASRRIWQQAQDLQQTITQLQASRVQLMEADVQVRRSIAEHLHGSVQTELIAIEHQVRGASLSDLADRVRKFRIAVIRDLSHQLHPMIIDVGLMPAVDDLVAKCPIKVSLKVTGRVLALDDFGGGQLPMRIRMAAYRIIQEALLNASSTGRASHASVSIDYRTAALHVEVSDDGVGLPDSVTFGLGLHSTDAWVRGLGGTWTLTSEPTGGATLVAQIPLALDYSQLEAVSEIWEAEIPADSTQLNRGGDEV